MRACKAVEERIVKDEVERGNKNALINLNRKYQGSSYSSLFQEALYKILNPS